MQGIELLCFTCHTNSISLPPDVPVTPRTRFFCRHCTRPVRTVDDSIESELVSEAARVIHVRETWREVPLSIIAAQMGLSKERVRQIEAQALAKMRRRLEWAGIQNPFSK